ncbi:MAG: hypothetical protein KDJ77_14715, partial [Rhodobiaceae bacterium]|nr:hypothetical protein [Rhodobiaceae bacterium]
MFARLSIWQKIVVVVSVTIATTVLIVAGTSVWREASRYAETRTGEILAIAKVLASTAAESTAAGDKMRTLFALRAIRDFKGANYVRIDLNDGPTFAEIGTGVILEKDIAASNARDPIAVLRGRPLIVSVPVRNAGQDIGTLTLMAGTGDVWQRIGSTLVDLLLASVIAATLGTVAASIMTRRITDPIKQLSTVMNTIRRRQDF